MTEGCVTATSAITCSFLDKLSPTASALQPLIQLQEEKFFLVPKLPSSHGCPSWGV